MRSMAWRALSINPYSPNGALPRVLRRRARQPPAPASHQGLTFVHFSAQCEHLLWDTLGDVIGSVATDSLVPSLWASNF